MSGVRKISYIFAAFGVSLSAGSLAADSASCFVDTDRRISRPAEQPAKSCLSVIGVSYGEREVAGV